MDNLADFRAPCHKNIETGLSSVRSNGMKNLLMAKFF